MSEPTTPRGCAALAKAVAGKKSYLISQRFEEYVRKHGELEFVPGPVNIYPDNDDSRADGVKNLQVVDPHHGGGVPTTYARGIYRCGDFLRIIELKDGASLRLAQMVLDRKLIPKTA